MSGCNGPPTNQQPGGLLKQLSEKQALKNQEASEEQLAKLSPEEILKTKYDQAELDCTLNFPVTVSNQGTQTTDPASTSLKWDLLENYSDTEVLPFEVQAASGSVDLVGQLKIDKVEIIPSIDINQDGTNYQLQYTPHLTGSFTAKTAHPILIDQGSIGVSVSDPFDLYENIPPSASATESGSTQNPNQPDWISYQLHLDCMFNTKLKPEYQNQWAKIQPTPEASPYSAAE